MQQLFQLYKINFQMTVNAIVPHNMNQLFTFISGVFLLPWTGDESLLVTLTYPGGS